MKFVIKIGNSIILSLKINSLPKCKISLKSNQLMINNSSKYAYISYLFLSN